MYTPLTQDQLDVHLRAARAERARVLGSLFGGIPSAIGRTLSRLAQRAERNAAIRELRMLDDSMLKDIGLYRGEIWHAADAAARGVDVRTTANSNVPTPILRPMPADTAPPANDNRDRVAPALMGAGRA